MRLKGIKTGITSKVGRQILITQKHSPTLLFVTGAIGLGATVILACKATLKVEEILAEAEANREMIEKEKISSKYTEEDHVHDTKLNQVKTGLGIAKLYAPAVVVGLVTIGAFTGSHVILTRRNAGLTAAYVALDKGFKEYRQRVVDEFGTDKDKEFRYNLTDREFAVDTENGTEIRVEKVMDPDTRGSIYGRLFSRETTRNWKAQDLYNQMFIGAQQSYANDLLNANGHLFLNEVYDMLGLARSKEGAVVGWIKGNGDGYIDFGLTDSYMGKKFIMGDEANVWLDFNVDGIVYDKI